MSECLLEIQIFLTLLNYSYSKSSETATPQGDKAEPFIEEIAVKLQKLVSDKNILRIPQTFQRNWM